MHPLKKVIIVLLLLASPALFAQGWVRAALSIGRSILKMDPINDYPWLFWREQEVSYWVQPIYEQQNLGAWTSDGSLVTFTLPANTTAQEEDIVRPRALPGAGAIVACQVWQEDNDIPLAF